MRKQDPWHVSAAYPSGLQFDDESIEGWSIIVPNTKQFRWLGLMYPLPRSGKALGFTAPSDVILESRHPPTLSFWSKLAKPVPYSTDHSTLSSSSNSVPIQQQCRLLCMPTELIAMIMDYLSKKNIIALGLASIKLWDHVLYYIRSTALANDSAPWAGKEIACVGTLVTDLPKSFNKYGPHSEYLSEYYSRPDMCPAKLFVAWASSFFSKPLPDRPGIKWLRSAHRWHTYTPPVQDIIRACDLGFRDRNLSWVLRNLDTYEYITCCCEAEMSDYDFKGRIRDFPQLNWRGFVKSKDEIHRWLRIEDVVVARICSSEERDHEPTPDAAKISMKGPWVGHRFDIVALGTQDFPNVEGWIDITTQIIDESDEYLKKLGRSRSDLMPLPCGSEISH